MADEKIKISELDEVTSLSGLYGVGANSNNETVKFRFDTTIDSKIAGKVDKVTGMGLSTNDYTTAEKNKLGSITAGAEVNVIERITVNGVEQEITDKTVELTISAEPEIITNAEIDSLFS